MCGIVGYTGKEAAAPILLDGLSHLEYRGYDSAGLAVRDGSALARVVKTKGKLRNLIAETDGGRALGGTCGIGHTRWATHGEPSRINAHPHVSGNCSGSACGPVEAEVLVFHNDIIKNYAEIAERLSQKGYRFYSQTDTEAAVKLVDYYYKTRKQGPIDAITRMMVRVRGSYALALMFREYPGEIFVARKDSPMIIGVTKDAAFLASDAPAILRYTRSVYYIGNMECARVLPGKVLFFDVDGSRVEKEPEEITWDAEAAEKGGFPHFMIKEIHEQPRAVRDTLGSLIRDGRADLSRAGLTDEILRSLSGLCIAACGSAWHVGVAAQYTIEDMAGLPVRVELASEFRYRRMLLPPDTLVVVVSQSGETADSLAALRAAKEAGLRTLAVVNVVGSTISREADHVLYTLAGPEIAVATTKAYSAQLAAMDVLAVQLALVRGALGEEKAKELLAALTALPEQIGSILEDKERIQWFASKFSNARDVFFIGRGPDYAVSLEGSLKMKEICYIHSEAYAAGELKHGTISLIEKGTLVIGVLTQDDLFAKTVSNMTECSTRGAYLMGLTGSGRRETEDAADFTVYIPRTDPHFMGSLAVIPLQLLAYYTGVARGLDVDQPRNLAKSVTVE